MSPVKKEETKNAGRVYWRGTEDFEDAPEAMRWMRGEFPQEDVQELLGNVSRRGFMSLMGASMALAGMTGCVRRPEEHILPYAKAPEDVLPGIPNYYASSYALGGYALGTLVESHEGRPTKIEGNPDHSASQGATTAWMQASVLDLYDPDRCTRFTKEGQELTRTAFVDGIKAKATELKGKQGAGLRFLAETNVSPTLQGLKKRLSESYPQAVWHSWEPINDATVFGGSKLVFGEPLRPVHKLETAKVIVSIDCDFMLSEPDAVTMARSWAKGRQVNDPENPMVNRLYAVEARFTITGSCADHRLRLRPSQLDGFVRTLFAKVTADSSVTVPEELKGALSAAASTSFGEKGDKLMAAMVKELLDNKGASAVMVGRGQPDHVHALVAALNVALGNTDKTVSYVKPVADLPDPASTTDASLAGLVAAMKGGQVDTLVILGGNPAYDTPADLGFAEALKGIATSIRLGSHVDETAELCKMVAPRSHFLEAWGDARAIDGTASLVQPLIDPLYNSLSDLELVSYFLDVPSNRGYDLVRAYWQTELASADFEKLWRRMLHDGVVAGSVFAGMSVSVTGSQLVGALKPLTEVQASANSVEVVFCEDGRVWDGRFANNGWLQELPDPMTKVTWDNVALMSFGTAKALGVKNHDRVKLESRGRSLELPVWILPGMADNTVALSLGYGRTKAGRVGTGVGGNTYLLRDSAALWSDSGVALSKADGRFRIASTQLHGRLEWYPVGEAEAPAKHEAEASSEGAEPGSHHAKVELRPVVQQADLADYQKVPAFAQKPFEHVLKSLQLKSLPDVFTSHEYVGQQWGMTVDMNVCTGCNSCVVACHAENNIPVVGKKQVSNGREMSWMRLDRYFTGVEADETIEVVKQPMMCQHCENAPCEPVCPVAATVHSKEGGINDMTYNRCIGTRYCANNCPYKVRRFNYFNYHEDFPEVQKMVHNPEVTVRMRGVMEKCSYCVQRVNRARRDMKLANKPMIPDGAITPACAQSCPVQAITFGDINDPNSRVAQMKKLERNYLVLPELNVRPRTSYLARIRNPNPELA